MPYGIQTKVNSTAHRGNVYFRTGIVFEVIRVSPFRAMEQIFVSFREAWLALDFIADIELIGNGMTLNSNRPINFALFKGIELSEMQFAAGEDLLFKGTAGTHMFLIKSGEVEVTLAGSSVFKITAGDIVGEMALIDTQDRSADVRALTAVVAVPVDEKKFLELVSKVPLFSLRVMRTMARRIRSLNEKLAG